METFLAYVRAILDSAPIGLAIVDGQGRLVAMNQLAAELEPTRWKAILAKARRETKASGLVKGPRLRTYEASIELLGPPWASGSALIAAQDVTGRLRTERERKEAIRVRDDFLSAAAHELRTPLTPLLLQLDVLLREVAGRSRLRREVLQERLASALRHGRRLARVVDHLLKPV